MARPYEKLPPGARSHLEAMASNGLLSETAAATALGMPLDQFRKVIRDHPPSGLIWKTALAVERDALFEALYKKAVDGDASAARTLLATRHGLTDKQPQGNSDKVSVVFNLPSALKPEDYAKLVQDEPQALEND